MGPRWRAGWESGMLSTRGKEGAVPDAMALAAVFYAALGAACVLIVAAIVLAGSGGRR